MKTAKIKLFLAIIMLTTMFACNSAQTPSPVTGGSNWYNVVKIDGCEYIEIKSGMGNSSVYSISHKGDCKNPIHCYNKVETKEKK